ncbi:MAG: hypothetical protein LBK95_16960 [Bifidobacteriaceae bacterium]|jgi:hypothetical protein|nr:hypothetical protein [Bifidobacteriaceae bacterium]
MVLKLAWRDQSEARPKAFHERLAGAVEVLVTGEDWVRAVAFAARKTEFGSKNAQEHACIRWPVPRSSPAQAPAVARAVARAVPVGLGV